MRRALVLMAAILIAVMTPHPATAQAKRIVIAADTVLDGKGKVLHNTRIMIEGSKIVAIDPKAGPVDYDLRGLTVLPGWIDAHAHVTWSFGPDGKNGGAGRTTPEAAYASAENAWATLMAGFTTIQSVGSPTDVPLRDAIAKGVLPGPRILTAVEPLAGRGPANWHARRDSRLHSQTEGSRRRLNQDLRFGKYSPGRRHDILAGATQRGVR